MSTPAQGTSGPNGRAGSRPAFGQPTQIPPEQSILHQLRRLIQSVETLQSRHEKESFVTKEQINALVESLDRLGLGTGDGDTARTLQPTRCEVLLAALEQTNEKLRVISDRIENTGFMRSDDRKVVSELVDEIRAAIADRKPPTPVPIAPGESPPPAPRVCFGRDELIERIVGLMENLTPIALIGAGGIGKTSIALTALHHDRIRRRFGDDRRFIRCDQFPTSCSHLLNRLSKVIGADVKNPEDFASLRPFLSSREMFVVLDNAESILDPQGADSDEIYAVVEELSQLDNICLCITSRLSAVPSDCETLDIPTLSIAAARDTFYRIYKNAERTDLVDDVLNQLDFHPLSITLLATVGHQNKWGMDRLGREWDRQRTRMLQTIRNKSLAATLELSLASPLFQELGPDARGLLEVIAFFPQGVDENNLEWLLPSILNGADIFNKFCILSLTYRSGSFVTMLAPLRDYLHPGDPKSSALLYMTKQRYFTRTSVNIAPSQPGYKEALWIRSEDVNVEYLLDVFTTIDANSESNWDACTNFIRHLVLHKPRLTILRAKIEGLSDHHRSNPGCLSNLAKLFEVLRNFVEQKRLLTRTLRLWRERGDERGVARVLRNLSNANRQMGLYEEGIQMAKEALGILERLGKIGPQGRCLERLAWLYHDDDQLDAAEEAAFRAMDLFSKEGDPYWVCGTHRLLGVIYCSKGEAGKAIHHLEIALRLASSSDLHNQLHRIHVDLVQLYLGEGRFDKAQAHVEHAQSYAFGHSYYPGDVMKLQAELWYRQGQFKEARSEALRAAEVYEKLGAAGPVEKCRELLLKIESGRTGCQDEPSDDELVTDSE